MQGEFKYLKRKLTTAPLLVFPDFETALVVENDASSVAFGAIIGQKNTDGFLHPIFFESRTMSLAERIFHACEGEALAVLFALRKFLVYLLSDKEFKFVKDNHTLQYVFQKKDIHDR